MKIVSLIFACFIIFSESTTSEPETQINCGIYSTCEKCISASIQCGWCLDDEIEEDENESIINRCINQNEAASRCKNYYSPKSYAEMEDGETSEFINIQPKVVNIHYRYHDTVKFDITATYLKELPMDIMFVAEYSHHMKDLLENIRLMSIDLLKECSKKATCKVGIMGFIDKNIFPIIIPSTKKGAVEPFYCKILSPLSVSDYQLKRFSTTEYANSYDDPEAVLEGILQTAMCGRIGWSKKGNVIKTIIVMTQAKSKSAGDGRMVGIIRPHDGKCHLDSDDRYMKGIDMDYPSVMQVANILKLHNFHLIFAVDDSVKSYYKKLQKAFNGVPSMIIPLRQKKEDFLLDFWKFNENFVKGFQILYDVKENLRITINTKCPGKEKSSEASCRGVTIGQKVNFEISVKVVGPLTINDLDLRISTFDRIKLTFTKIQKCACSEVQESTLANTAYCNNHGREICKLCKCELPWRGKKCECSLSNSESLEQCTDPDTHLLCSYRGKCVCGKCECSQPGVEIVSGEFCECTQLNCFKFQEEICGGPTRGECVCDKCECEPIYAGKNCGERNCENEEWEEDCIDPITDLSCNGKGKCECGICICESRFSGEYCSQIKIPYECSDFVDDAYCLLFKNSTKSNSCVKSDTYLNTSTNSSGYECVYQTVSGCFISYNFLASNSTYIQVNVKAFDKIQDCPKTIDWNMLAVITFTITLLIGLVLLALYVFARYLYEKSVYQNYLKEKSNAMFKGDSPLYKSSKAPIEPPEPMPVAEETK